MSFPPAHHSERERSSRERSLSSLLFDMNEIQFSILLKDSSFPTGAFPLDSTAPASVLHQTIADVKRLNNAGATPIGEQKKEAIDGNEVQTRQPCIKITAEFLCGHNTNFSNHRTDCKRGIKCSQYNQTRTIEPRLKPCRNCVAAAKAGETWEDVQRPLVNIDEDYLQKSVHSAFLKNVSKPKLQEKNMKEKVMEKGGAAVRPVLERVASHLRIQRIEKRLEVRGKTRQFLEGPVIVGRMDAADLILDDDIWEEVDADDEGWVEIIYKETDLVEL